MVGDTVLVRGVDDEARIVRVWRDEGNVVLVCGVDDEALDAISKGEAIPIGCRRADVYRYDPAAAMDGGTTKWETMTPY